MSGKCRVVLYKPLKTHSKGAGVVAELDGVVDAKLAELWPAELAYSVHIVQ